MRLAPLVLVATLALALSACTAPSGDAAGHTATPSPTPTIDVGPVQLSVEDAGVYYLSIVCQVNNEGAALHDAFVAAEPAYLAGGDPDATAIKSIAAEKVRVLRLAAEVLDDPYFTFPELVTPQLKHIRDSFIAELSAEQAIMNAANYAEAYKVVFPVQTPEQAAAGQEVRYQLGLNADTVASCVGYETALDEVHAEMLKRNDYLASFDG